ncbi:helix-turn-helix domain-containing protein [Desulforamulus reducens]|uniref:helix-turn-helix domain-containing protein n=1 Tax=Desulforamulus reducens TaxID=59610 RepID=UPI0002EDFEE4|nr:helix-turn-helix domain-containing protein [Desulforamulus reducens]
MMNAQCTTYTVPEVAKMLRKRKSTVYEMVYSGEIRASKLGERGIRITAAEVQKYLNKQNILRGIPG